MRWLWTWWEARDPHAGIPSQSFVSQEIQVLEIVKTKEAIGQPGGARAIKAITDYQNAGLEISASELVTIWPRHKSKSTVLRDAARDIRRSDPIAYDSLVKFHFGKYWVVA